MTIMLVVGGLQEVKPRVSGWATTVVSAVGAHVPRSALPTSFAGARHLVLPFRDTTDYTDPDAFSADLAARLVAFARSAPSGDERVVVHCAAGVGRSPAVAYAYLVAAGVAPGEALAEVFRVRPQAQPNALVVARADAELGGALWPPFERWARATDWWGLRETAALGPQARLDALRVLRNKRPVGQPKPRRPKRRR